MHLKSLHTPRKINIFLYAVIIFLIGLIFAVFFRHQILLKTIETPLAPERSDASLSIQKFHHTATRNGSREWSLEADSADFFAEKNMARLTGVSVTFHLKDGQNIFLRADEGLLDTKTNDMKISGNIDAIMPQYKLKTENLNYDHLSHIIYSNTPVAISGSSGTLRADTLSYEMETKKLTCNGNVEGTFLENFTW